MIPKYNFSNISNWKASPILNSVLWIFFLKDFPFIFCPYHLLFFFGSMKINIKSSWGLKLSVWKNIGLSSLFLSFLHCKTLFFSGHKKKKFLNQYYSIYWNNKLNKSKRERKKEFASINWIKERKGNCRKREAKKVTK